MEISDKRKTLLIFGGLILIFCFRLSFGLCLDFWANSDDEKQIYLIGLKYSTTGQWPYFGPDVSSGVQIPGALQGLLVGIPLRLLPIPEAPYIFLNFLSFTTLVWFAWYCRKRLPGLPGWLVCGWLMTAPWTINFSTQVVNPSYVLPAAILFFCAVIETYPFMSRNLISPNRAAFIMGFTIFWIMQLHLSWVVLIPYLIISLYFQQKNSAQRAIRFVLWFVAGAILPATLLFPTLIKFGFNSGNTLQMVGLNSHNLLQALNPVEGVLGRFLSFASFEIPRFIGRNTVERWEFARQHLWLLPILVLLTFAGLIQPLALLVLWFRKHLSQPDWPAMKHFTLATLVLLYLSFAFTAKAPSSHTFYLTLPVAMLYSFYCWEQHLKKRLWRRVALMLLVCGFIFDVALAAHKYSTTSLYVDRSRIQQAIDQNDYRLVGERRPGAQY